MEDASLFILAAKSAVPLLTEAVELEACRTERQTGLELELEQVAAGRQGQALLLTAGNFVNVILQMAGTTIVPLPSGFSPGLVISA